MLGYELRNELPRSRAARYRLKISRRLNGLRTYTNQRNLRFSRLKNIK